MDDRMAIELSPYAYPLGLGLIAVSLRWIRRRYKPSHRRRVKAAKRVMTKLYTIDNTPQRLAYLRKIDPFTFEELVLEALDQRGHRVKRNKRYTGDGGIDGQCWINGKHALIQSKRYRNHINVKHVRDFATLLERRNCHGLFVHTGRTGKASQEIANSDPRLTIISGDGLVRLLTPPRGA